MKSEPAISIIIPVYNAEKFLPRCIDSILNQTFENFELILVDDCSSDSSANVCKEYAERDCRVRFFQNEHNIKTSATQNFGIKKARGKYLMFCDNDDYVDSNWCMLLFDAIEMHPDALITSNYCFDNGNRLECRRKQFLDEPIIYKTDFYDLFINGGLWFTWNKIFRRDIFLKNNLTYNNYLSENGTFADQDVLLVAEYCKYCTEYYYISRPLYYYYKNEDSITRNYRYNLLYANLIGFQARFPLVSHEKIESFCNIYFHNFILMFDNIFDKRNTQMNFLDKMRYNQKIVKSDVFQLCLKNISEKNISPLLLKILKNRYYYLYWGYQTFSKIKHRLFSNLNTK